MKLLISLLSVSLLVLITGTCVAQEMTINTDRPDQTDGTYTLPVRTFQIENGIFFAKKTVVNNFMLRYGLTHTTEARLILDAGKELANSGLQPVTISLKQRIGQQQNIIPAIAILGDLTFDRFASKDFQEKGATVAIALAFENEISDKFSLGYNIGMSDNFNTVNLTFETGYAPSGRISTFLEYFSAIRKHATEHNIDAGILYLINSKLQVDFALGRAIFDSDERLFSTFGISYFFN